MRPSAEPTPPDLVAELRAGTAAAHAALEAELDLLRPHPTAARFRAALCGFWGVQAAWEPAMEARCDLRDLFEGRARAAALAADLRALGLSDEAMAALPVCQAFAGLCDTRGGALGSLYVMEGSTLGGRVIARHLAGEPWPPPGGFAYFDGRGARTGPMWRTLLAGLERRAASPAERAEVVEGARDAFHLMRRWMATAMRQSADGAPVSPSGSARRPRPAAPASPAPR